MHSNGVKCWGMSSAKYVQEAVCNVKDYITKNLDGLKLKKKAKFAWPSNYMVEDDESTELPSGDILPTLDQNTTLDGRTWQGRHHH